MPACLHVYPDDGHGSGRHLCRRKADGADNLPAVEKKIAAEGFADVEYNTWMYGRWLNLDENNEKKYYVFQAKKDGQTWQIAADPKGGQLVQITAAED